MRRLVGFAKRIVGRRLSASLVCRVAAFAAVFATTLATAAPVVFSDLTIIENRPADDIFGFAGLYLLTRVDASTDAVSATVSSSDPQFPFASPASTPVPLSQSPAGGTTWLKLFPIAP